MKYLTEHPIDVAQRQEAVAPQSGARVEFSGIVRGEEQSRPIEALEYEAYAPMAEAMMSRLVEEAKRRWALHRVEVRHRTGRVPAGEAAVFVGVQAAHRDEAFAACRFLIDRIKEEVPIWKRAVFVHDAESGS